MAKADFILSLIKAHFNNESERFITVVLQIAAYEAKLGHNVLSQNIRSLVERHKSGRNKTIRTLIPNELQGLILESYPNKNLNDLIASDHIKGKIERIVHEYVNRDKLFRNDLNNRRKILLSGNPGTGKTFTASIIAMELGLPFNTILMEKLVTKFMGETSMRLRQVFDIIRDKPGVYLFDEFDAIGGERGKENDVGEMRRVLNSFLQFLEQDDSDSVIIAVTNNSQLLDQALFRRFDDIINYQLPTENEKMELLKSRFYLYGKDLDYDKIIKHINGLSHAEITRACTDAIKATVLDDKTQVTNELLIKNIDDRNAIYKHQ